MMDRLELHLLGSPEVRLNDKSLALKERKALALLIYLAVTREPHQRETLATLFWPDLSVKRSRRNLRRIVWVLKKAISEERLQVEGEMICLSQRADVWTDLIAFKALMAQRNDQQGLLPPATVAALEQAVSLYRGEFLSGFTLPDTPDFDEWQFFEAETMRQAMVLALDDLVLHYTQAINYEVAIGHARHHLALDPLHEPAHQTLMRLYALSGRQAAALRQFDECQRILQDELGIAPDAETQALATAIREKRLTPPDAETIAGPAEASPPTPKPPEDTAPQDASQNVTQQPRPVFMGRKPQLVTLDDALTQALTGQGQLRLITGEAGAGKTALITEFLHQIQRKGADLTDLTIAIGSSDAQTGQMDPFLPFREVLLDLLGGTTSDQPSAWRPSACLALLEHGPDMVDSFIPPAHLPALVAQARAAGWQGEGPTAKQPLTGQSAADQSRIIEQYVAVLGAIAARSPLILVLEDLHWADMASLGLLFRLGRQLENNRLLILGTYRSEQAHLPGQDEENALDKMLRELQRHQGHITIDLEAVRLTEGRELVDGLLDTEPNQLNESFRQALYQHTGGHPLFVVELLEDLKERAALIRNQAGDWIVGDKLDWRNLPGRVEGAIAGRIAHLSDEQRWLLTIASVSGERFLAEVVAHVAGSETRQIAQTLSQELQTQHRLVEAEGVERLESQRLTRYRFRHNLIQVYLYEQLDQVQRIYLHEDVARALETLYGEAAKQIALPLARHYQAAGVTEKAVAYLILAGEQAVRLSAYEEAAQHFSQALSMLATLPDGLEHQRQELALQLNLGQALLISQGFGAPEVGVTYTRALALARQLGETGQIIQALLGLTQHALYRSELAVAQAYGEECLHLAAENQDPERMMAANHILRRIAHSLGQHAETVRYGEQIIAFYREQRLTLTFDDAFTLAFTLAVMGLNLTPLGYPDRALRQAQEGLTLVRRHIHHFGIVYCLNLMAYIHLRRGEWQAAWQLAAEAVTGSQTHNFPQMCAFAQIHQGVALTRLGQAETGIKLVRQAVAEREAMGVIFGNQTALAQLAEACGLVGRVAEGLTLVNEALADLDISNDRQYEPKMHQIKGDLLLLQDLTGDDLSAAQQEAQACFRRAIEIAQYQQAKLWEARALASLCRLLHSQGRDEGCCQQLADLYAWFTEGFETEDLQVVRAVLQEAA
jgi:predicted ATPase/DNA-binding SARP family transcriptional activator